jgi:hypothetical protein
MPFTGIASPQQMDVIVQALNAYCSKRCIENRDMRENLAALAASLYFSGETSVEGLLAAMHDAEESKRPYRASR